MGKPCFSKVIKFFAVALLGAAAAIAAVAVLSSPAAAHNHGGGGDGDDYPWDTDNLRYADGSYNARSFNIPYHNYDSYSGAPACQKNVADAFFQAGGSVGAVNDFPYLGWVADADGNESWAVQESGVRNDGCDEFVAQQDKMQNQIRRNGGYYLDISGKLQKLSGDPPSRFSVRSSNYVHWIEKGSGFSMDVNGNPGWVRSGNDYLERVDGYRSVRADGDSSVRAIYPSSTTWVLPTENSSRYGQFGARWHGAVSRGFVRVAKPRTNQIGFLPENIGMCPAGFHPRGEDSVDRIGSYTGRTLSGLSQNLGAVADGHWCRSDLRFARAFETQNHGVDLHPAAAGMTGAFQSYGRLNCYYTAFSSAPHGSSGTEGIRPASSGGLVCSYLFPIPQCDPDTDNGSDSDWRDYTAEELKDIADDLGSAKFDKDDGDACPPEPTPDPQDNTPRNAASFSDPACVTATLSIYENRVVGSDAEPGVTTSDQTLAVAAGRTAWDLDITSPHHNTASPPRDIASTPADATGCADGSESRADHSSDAGSAVRKNTGAGVDLALPTSSTASQSTHPPHSKGFRSAGTDYTGAVRNIAHRYASNVAENTCAAKRAEAELVLSEMKARRLRFQRYIDSYESSLDAAIGVFGGYRSNTQTGSDLGLKVRQYNAEEARRAGYVALRKAHLDNLKLALADAESAYQAASSQSVTALSNSGCVAAYDTKITNLRTVQKNAEDAFPSTVSSRAGISSVNTHLRNFNAQAGPNLNVGSPTFTPATLPVLSRPSPPSWGITGWPTSRTEYFCNVPAGESGYSLNSDNECTKQVTSTTSFIQRGTRRVNGKIVPNWVCPTGYSPYWTVCRRTDTSTGTVSRTITYFSTETYSSGPHTGTITGSYTDPTTGTTYTKTVGYSRTFTGRRSCQQATGYNSYPRTCGTASHRASGRTPAQAKAMVEGTKPAATPTPGFSPPTKPAAHANVSDFWLLGKYHPQHPDRSNLKAASTSDRDAAAINLGSLSAGNIATAATGATYTPQNIANLYVPTSWTGTTAASRRSDLQTETNDYKTAYTSAYNNAYTQATTDMGSTATTSTWNRFDWRYQTSTLDWGSYQEDTATTYSGWVAQAGETEADRNGTGCDLINVAADGTVSVEATRLDYETSKYGKGSVFGTRTDAQRTCKIRRTRTPELLLEYQPSAPSGTDTSKAAAFWHVNYQPTAASERFKLYDEAEVFAVKASLADRAPVLCYQPGEALVAHVGAKGIDAVHKAVFRNASGFAGGNKTHCYRHPSSAQLGSPPRPAFAFFDDTAHSAMDSVSVVWQQPNPKIVSKLGSTDDLKMMANSVALVANAVAYADATRTSSFYGTYYTFPTDSSVESPSGWDISGHPTLTLTSTFRQHVAQAKDAAAKTPTSHAMVFKFVDCVFGIEDVAFVDNIASPYALQTEWAGASSMKTK